MAELSEDTGTGLLPPLTLAVLSSIALKTFVFILCLGVPVLLAYILVFLHSQYRTNAPSHTSPPRKTVVFTAVILDYLYLSCCFILYNMGSQPFDFYYIILWGMALYLTLFLGLLVAVGSLAALWFIFRHSIIRAMRKLTKSTRGRDESMEMHAEGGPKVEGVFADLGDGASLMEVAGDWHGDSTEAAGAVDKSEWKR